MKQSSGSPFATSMTVRIIKWLIGLIQNVSVKTAARFAAQLFTLPRRFRRPQREMDLLEGSRSTRVKHRRGHIAMWTWGDGPEAVLLTHGWEGRESQLGSLAAPLVSAGYRVIAFDAPGHGESAGYQTNLVRFADTILDIGAAQPHLRAIVAHSFGAAAATLALSRGLEVDCAVFVAPPARFDHYLELFSEAFGLSAQTLDKMVKLFESKFSLQWSALNPVEQATSMQLPMLAIHDHDDSEVPWENSKSLCKSWPGAQLITTTGLGHRRILRDPKVVSDIVLFVKQKNSQAFGASMA